jgi:5,10-methylenetetrahydromethanopterin reductase
MQFGIRLVQHIGDVETMLALAELADREGLDSVWFTHDPFMRNPWVVAAAAAQRTTQTAIGASANPYFTHPAEIATFAATLDEVSNGRAVVGIGLHSTEMLAWVGCDGSDVLERTRQAVEIVRALLAGETLENIAHGWAPQSYLRFGDAPREVPIYVSAFGRAFLALSGEIGDGSLVMVMPPETASLVVDSVKIGATAEDHTREIVGCAWLSLGRNSEAAADALRPLVATFGPYFGEEQLATVGLTPDDFATIKQLQLERREQEARQYVNQGMLRLGIVGDPDDVTRQVEKLGLAGVTHISFGGPLGPDPFDAVRLLCQEVIPRFR